PSRMQSCKLAWISIRRLAAKLAECRCDYCLASTIVAAEAHPRPGVGKKVPGWPPAKPPSVRARQLAAELRQLREASGLTGEEVASRLAWSASKVSRIETTRTPARGG